jgi:pimeloyl-ACP methyl ester carboxylesterase
MDIVRHGHGPAIVLVHGTASDHSRWNMILPALKDQFTVYAIDRGGGDDRNFGSRRLENEFTELAALIDGIEEGRVDVVAHSFGAICALEAALRTRRVRRLVLYEPPISTSYGSYHTPDVLPRIRDLIGQGKREAALDVFYSEVAKIPPRQLLAMRALPRWKNEVKAVHTMLWELECIAQYEVQPDQFKNWQIPTLLLLGGKSPSVYRAGIERLHAILPGSKIVSLDGQAHGAMQTAPDMFLREILDFLK